MRTLAIVIVIVVAWSPVARAQPSPTVADLMRAQRPIEAIAELQRRIRVQPARAVHHCDLARTYLELGMGAAARRAARRAVALEPRSAEAHATLGLVLRHDSLGRDHGFDHDRAGALAAFTRALELTPAHLPAAEGLAETLAYDAQGVGVDAASRPQLIAALRGVYALDPTTTRARRLAVELLAFDPGEADAVLRPLAPSGERDGALVAAIAATGSRGVAEAIRLAGSLRADPPSRDDLLAGAEALLVDAGRFDAARALRAAAGLAPLNSWYSAVYANARHRPIPALGRDPVELWFAGERWLRGDRSGPSPFWDADTERELRELWGPIEIERTSHAHRYDLLRAGTQITVHGTAAAWRLDVRAWAGATILYAVLDGGVAKLVGGDGGGGVGRHATRLLARGDVAAATELIERYVAGKAALAKVWSSRRPNDREAVALFALIIDARGSQQPPRALELLARCPIAAARELCDEAHGAALLRQHRWAELEAHTAAWLRRAVAPAATQLRAFALVGLRRFDEADRTIAAALAAGQRADRLARMPILVAVARGDLPEAIRRADAVLARPDAHRGDKNEAAWVRLFAGTDLAAGRDLARDGLSSVPAPPDNHFNTLAALELELGELMPAKEHGWVGGGTDVFAPPRPSHWYVYARLAEALGLRDDAIAGYRRVTPGPNAVWGYDASVLARRRLAALGAKP